MINHPSLLVNVLIVVGEGFWVFSTATQLIQLYRTRNTRGLSPPSQTLYAAGSVAWATYFAVNHLWYPFVTNIIIIFLGTAVLGYTLSNRKKFGQGLTAIAVVGPVTSYLLIAHPGAGGWLGMSYNWIAGTPWLFRVIRRKKVSGISENSMYFALGAMICVLSYGLIIHSWPLITGCIQGLIYESIMLKFYYRHRRHG
ncbi:MAG TPA: PQ-loop domain-containing transporter [Candidatus Dormibacteraeota bacterium]|nr:PQ-loop domain-containing transporter [Candidatus Dormibacteraeota bacterium]